MDQGNWKVLEPAARQLQHGGIAIQADQPPRRCDPLGQKNGMAPPAHRGIDDNVSGLRRQVMHHLLRQDREMTRGRKEFFANHDTCYRTKNLEVKKRVLT